MPSIDLRRFWEENDAALIDPFSPANAHVPINIGMGYHTVFDELGIEEDLMRFEREPDYARRCATAYNDLAEQIVGRRLLDENAYDPKAKFPRTTSLGEIFGCPRVWQANSWWLLEAAGTSDELCRLLDRVERQIDDMRSAIFPPDWDEQCQRIFERNGIRAALGNHLRGPVTLATSIYGVENLLLLILDEPKLAERFRDVLTRAIVAYYDATTAASDPGHRTAGFWFADDNCALLTPEMYAFFGQPIVRAVYDHFAPRPGDVRYQHSDSDMGHQLPLLAQTGMNRVNFGPNVRFRDIRAAMPRAIVEGTMAPFTMMRNDVPRIVQEVRRDLDESRETRGLVIETAGSVNNGTRLSSLRVVIETVDRHGR